MKQLLLFGCLCCHVTFCNVFTCLHWFGHHWGSLLTIGALHDIVKRGLHTNTYHCACEARLSLGASKQAHVEYAHLQELLGLLAWICAFRKASHKSLTSVSGNTGDRELFDEAGPLLEVMGKKSFFLGTDVGLGAKMKLVINMVCLWEVDIDPLRFR